MSITRKEDHRVVDNGPYAIVRHPIYTGLIAATLATAAAQATLPAIIGAALITFGLWMKARMEEAFLSAELPAEAYTTYCGPRADAGAMAEVASEEMPTRLVMAKPDSWSIVTDTKPGLPIGAQDNGRGCWGDLR